MKVLLWVFVFVLVSGMVSFCFGTYLIFGFGPMFMAIGFLLIVAGVIGVAGGEKY